MSPTPSPTPSPVSLLTPSHVLSLVNRFGLCGASNHLAPQVSMAEVTRLYGQALIDNTIPFSEKAAAFVRIDQAIRTGAV